MKILLINEYFYPKVMGGGEINLFELAKALVKNKHDVYVLTSKFEGLKEYETINGIKIYRRLKTGHDISSFFSNYKRIKQFPCSVEIEAKKLTKEINPDIIHFIGSSLLAAKYLKKLNIPLVSTVESLIALCPKEDFICGNKVDISRWSFFKFVKCLFVSEEIGRMKNKFYLKYNPFFWLFVYNRYKKLNKSLRYVNLIAISEFVGDLLLKFENLKSEVIPNFFNISEFDVKQSKSNKNKSDKNNKKIKLLYLGSLNKFKGPQFILEAIKGLKNVRLDIYGDGPLKQMLLDKISQYSLDAAIHEHIGYKDIPKAYANSDIVIFPPLRPEPFGRIPIEAMASGKPVIASNIGAIPETVEDAGILFDPGNIQQLRESIRLLADNKELREKLAKKGRLLAKNYDQKVTVKKMIGFYEKVK